MPEPVRQQACTVLTLHIPGANINSVFTVCKDKVGTAEAVASSYASLNYTTSISWTKPFNDANPYRESLCDFPATLT